MAAGLDLIIYWHLHQPDYRDVRTGEYRLPWTYLHAIKDYADMAAHAETHSRVHLTFNFVPVLVEQLDDYAEQFRTKQFRDPLLRWLLHEDLNKLSLAERREILRSCFRVNEETMLHPFPAYRRLLQWSRSAGELGDIDIGYLSAQYFADLLMWYHLSWTGETVRRAHPQILDWMHQGSNFTLTDRAGLAQLIGRVIRELLGRFRALAQRGQLELSTTPYFHPILPLLQSFDSAREAWPEVNLPECTAYPGGSARGQAHVQAAIAFHEHHFGSRPRGMWPAEGGVSTATAETLAANDIAWMATGQAVLRNSLRQSHGAVGTQDWLHSAYRIGPGKQIVCFFRDDRLSDRIGFEYSKWHADDAVPDLINELERIANDAPPDSRPLVTLLLDGENAWEYYPFNGYYFISKLYTTLEHHSFIGTVTPAMWLSERRDVPSLPTLCAGSWVYGTFSTWIGAPEKNRAWELLCEAKRAYDRCVDALSASQREQATRQLGICEGSDWFWWLGDYNPSDSVASFDSLFRENLRSLYSMLGLQPPSVLDTPIAAGAGNAEVGGVMRRSA